MRRPWTWIASTVVPGLVPRASLGVALLTACGSVGGETGDGAPVADGAAHADAVAPADAPPAFNYAFVTADTHVLGAIGGVANADAICQAAADAGDPRLHGRTYRAWLSDSTADAIDRLGDAQGWRRLDGAIVALSAADLTRADRVLTPPRLDEHGRDLVGASDVATAFATGTTRDGRATADTCLDWTSTEGRGATWRVDEAWHVLYPNTSRCDEAQGLLCLGVDVTIPIDPPTPPSATAPIVFVAALGAAPQLSFAALDAVCRMQSELAGWGGRHVAALATTSVAAPGRVTPSSGPWYRPDGIVAVADPAAFVSGGPPTAPIRLTADGALAPSNVLTGTADWGTVAMPATNCDDYTFTNTSHALYFGQPFRSSHNFAFAVGYGCGGALGGDVGVYCLPTE